MTIECELIDLYGFLGKKWTMVLLHNLSAEPISFVKLERISHKTINPTILSNRLKKFVQFKIIKKINIKKKPCYVLTKEGIRLKALFHKIKKIAIQCDYNIPEVCTQDKCHCDEVFENRKIN